MLHATLLASRILRWPLKKFVHTYNNNDGNNRNCNYDENNSSKEVLMSCI
jgi:hypothetical protein